MYTIRFRIPSSSIMMILVEFLSTCSRESSGGCKSISLRLYSSGACKAMLSLLIVKFMQMEKTLVEKLRVLLIISACIAVCEVNNNVNVMECTT